MSDTRTMEHNTRQPFIARLTNLGFVDHPYWQGTFHRRVGGKRYVYVQLRGERGLSYYWTREFGWRHRLEFTTVGDMELAIIYQVLVNRITAWPIDWLGGPNQGVRDG